MFASQPRRGTLIASLVTCAMLPITIPSTIPSAIAQTTGSLNWGIRTSFNNYTLGPTKVSDGASRSADGREFTFTLANETYDAATNTTTAQFNGTVIYRKYCDKPDTPMEGNCQLDLHISNPKVVISDNDSYLAATVSSRQYLSSEVYAPKDPVKIAKLRTTSATFTQKDGTVNWKEIAATLTAEGNKMFSDFYHVGEGLDPVSFTYQGQGGRPKSDTLDKFFTPDKWTSRAAYDDGVHHIWQAANNLIVAMPHQGFALLNDSLQELAFVEADLDKANTSTFDSTNNVIYYAADNQIKSIALNGTTFGETKTVHTDSKTIYALGYQPATDTVAAIATDASDQFATANLITGTKGTFTSQPLPATSVVMRDFPKYSGTQTWGDWFKSDNNAELLPLSDGTFAYYPQTGLKIDDDDQSSKGLIFNIQPGATGPELAKAMKGSHNSSNHYMDNLASNGTTLYRFDKNDSADDAWAQELRYDPAKRDVVAVTEPTAEPEAAKIHGWAAVAFDNDGTPIQENGVTGDLNWLVPGQLSIKSSFPIPQGKRTNMTVNDTFLVRKDGAIFLPEVDESRQDYVSHYVLRRLNTGAAAQPPAEVAVTPADVEVKFKELQAKARQAATKAQQNALDEAESTLEQATFQGMNAKDIAILTAERDLAKAQLDKAGTAFDLDQANTQAQSQPDNTAAQDALAKAQTADAAATAAIEKAKQALAAAKAAPEPTTPEPTTEPTTEPSAAATTEPTTEPSAAATTEPTAEPTTTSATAEPTTEPTSEPTTGPTTTSATAEPTTEPTTASATAEPSVAATTEPSAPATTEQARPTVDEAAIAKVKAEAAAEIAAAKQEAHEAALALANALADTRVATEQGKTAALKAELDAKNAAAATIAQAHEERIKALTEAATLREALKAKEGQLTTAEAAAAAAQIKVAEAQATAAAAKLEAAKSAAEAAEAKNQLALLKAADAAKDAAQAKAVEAQAAAAEAKLQAAKSAAEAAEAKNQLALLKAADAAREAAQIKAALPTAVQPTAQPAATAQPTAQPAATAVQPTPTAQPAAPSVVQPTAPKGDLDNATIATIISVVAAIIAALGALGSLVPTLLK